MYINCHELAVKIIILTSGARRNYRSVLISLIYLSRWLWIARIAKRGDFCTWGPARVNSDKWHGPKSSDSASNEIATRDNLPRPNCDNKRQALITTDTRRFKIQTGNMGPPFLAGPLYIIVTKVYYVLNNAPTFFGLKLKIWTRSAFWSTFLITKVTWWTRFAFHVWFIWANLKNTKSF